MNDEREKLDALYEIGRRLIEQVEGSFLVDPAGNPFNQNIYFIEFKRLIESPDSVKIDPELQAFDELLNRQSQISE